MVEYVGRGCLKVKLAPAFMKALAQKAGAGLWALLLAQCRGCGGTERKGQKTNPSSAHMGVLWAFAVS